MATITEDYVSFEVAKLLKEKGFNISLNSNDWLCCMYDENGNIHWGTYAKNWYFRITLQMAMKWLREVHNLFIEIKYATSLFSQPHTTIYFQICYMSLDYNTSGKNMLPDNYIRECYTSYEEACEAAIKYCLENLI